MKTMIINNTLQGMAGVYTNSGAMNKVAKKYDQDAAATGAGDIQISSKAQQFNDILKKLSAQSEVRQDKVVEYENLIASGKYSVSSQDLAERIMQFRY